MTYPAPPVALQHAISTYALHGWKMEHADGDTAVMVSGRRPNNALHGVLTLLAGGFWGLIRLFEVIGTYEQRMHIVADDQGRVSYQVAKSTSWSDLVGPIVGIVIAATIVTLYFAM